MPGKDLDKKLIQDLIKGDSFAFDELYVHYYNKTYNFSYRYLQNKQDAEEVVQEVFISVWNNREKLKKITNLNAWLFTITYNQVRKVFRNIELGKKKIEDLAMSKVFEDNPTLSEVEYNDLISQAGDIIQRIPTRQKDVLLLSIKEGLSTTEISTKLNISKRTVENHLSSARAYLRKVFKDEHLIPIVILWFLL
jgi:RNA polymerase sigma-70 factor (ECF subfamily)